MRTHRQFVICTILTSSALAVFLVLAMLLALLFLSGYRTINERPARHKQALPVTFQGSWRLVAPDKPVALDLLWQHAVQCGSKAECGPPCLDSGHDHLPGKGLGKGQNT